MMMTRIEDKVDEINCQVSTLANIIYLNDRLTGQKNHIIRGVVHKWRHAIFDNIWYSLPVSQGSQTRGPRARCGPLEVSVRPETLFLTDKIRHFDQKWTNFAICHIFPYSGPWSHSHSKLQPADLFSIQMWPFDGFEFETTAVRNDFEC
jgi:hypothetical protein